jgi:predicted N-acetyltransferase YhbS
MSSSSTVHIRRAAPEDAPAAGRICYEAFAAINRQHNFPPDIPSPDAAIGLLERLFTHPRFYCVIAEANGKVVGSNCLDERGAIAGLGPITVDPAAQNSTVGRQLMNAMLDRGRERALAGIRLLQSAFHNRSLSLYTKLGFDAREPMSVMQGPAIKRAIEGCDVRPATLSDIEAANRVCLRVHGHDRSGELRDSIDHGTASVVERRGRLTGYASAFGFFGHAVAESLEDLQALIASADGFSGPGLIVPTRNGELFRWCLTNGLRVVQPLTLMTTGLYNEPAGAYVPSILY